MTSGIKSLAAVYHTAVYGSQCPLVTVGGKSNAEGIYDFP